MTVRTPGGHTFTARLVNARLGDVVANDPNACQPQLHPLNDPAPLTKWLPWLILGATVLGALATRKGSR